MNHPERRTSGPRRDLLAAGLAALLVTAAVVVGRAVEGSDGSLHVNWPPLYAVWDPHVGPGTPAALAVAAAVVAHGPALAARLPWRALLAASWAASTAWIWSLALVDGWHRGVAVRLTTKYEYLQVVDRFADIPATLRDYTQYILLGEPGAYHWPVLLDRIGLGGGGWAGAFVITAGSTAVIAVLITLKALGDEASARRAAPFLVLAPAAVWMGTSADGYFAAVAAWLTALLALAATRTVRRPAVAACAAGLLYGLLCYLSYGLTLFAVIAAGVLVLARTVRPLPYFVAGALVVPAVFTAFGFDWWEAYHLLVERYYQGAGGVRPYWYWIWANPACTVLIAGLATVAGVRRAAGASPGAVRRWRAGASTATDRVAGLALAALLAVAVADASGMSKAETERIWLPFAVLLLTATALLPERGRRLWLTAQAVLALAVNHLLLTGW
ncbi:hypothetical protein AB0I46_12820 [Streptomyces spectabilis]|uniref:hypothetical protein n=2 Tax=Streptomyces spectabilis TaxID=68270 RepID=UPI0033F6EABB